MNFKLMAEHTRYLKENAKGVDGMCKIMEEMRTEAFEEGRQIGMRIGMQEGKRWVALRMLARGKYLVEEICNICELPSDEVEKLKTEQALACKMGRVMLIWEYKNREK